MDGLYQFHISDLNFEAFFTHLGPFLEKAWIPLLEVVCGVVLGPFVKRILMRAARNAPDQGALTFLASFSNITIIVFSIILAIEQLGINMTSIVALVSALGLGVSLAVKNNMANVAGGIQILLTKPFVVGDYIRIDEHKGVVKSIELMFTTLVTDNNKLVVVPNDEIVTNLVTNYSQTPTRRLRLVIPVKLPDDIPKVCARIQAIVEGDPRILKDPPLRVTVDKVVEGYANILLIAYVDWEDYERCKEDFNYKIVSNLKQFQPQPKADESSSDSE